MSLMLLIGCASTSNETLQRLSDSNGQMRRDIEALKEQMASPRDDMRGLERRVGALEEERRKEQAEFRKLSADMRDKVALLGDQVEALGKRIEEFVAQARSVRSGAPLFRPSVYDLVAAYQTALRDCLARRFDQAIGEFSEILSLSPHSEFGDNAQYWLAECYYGLGNYKQAIAEFQKVLSYRDTDKEDDAQLKIGYSYLQSGDPDRALAALKKLLADYPDSEYAGRAEARIEELEGRR